MHIAYTAVKSYTEFQRVSSSGWNGVSRIYSFDNAAQIYNDWALPCAVGEAYGAPARMLDPILSA